jgi:hypothetical protein
MSLNKKSKPCGGMVGKTFGKLTILKESINLPVKNMFYVSALVLVVGELNLPEEMRLLLEEHNPVDVFVKKGQ